MGTSPATYSIFGHGLRPELHELGTAAGGQVAVARGDCHVANLRGLIEGITGAAQESGVYHSRAASWTGLPGLLCALRTKPCS